MRGGRWMWRRELVHSICSGKGDGLWPPFSCFLLELGAELLCSKQQQWANQAPRQPLGWKKIYFSLSSHPLFKSLHRLNWALPRPGCHDNSHMTPQTALLRLYCCFCSSLKGPWSLWSEMHKVPQLTTPWANRDLQRAWEKTYQDHRKKVGRHLLASCQGLRC